MRQDGPKLLQDASKGSQNDIPAASLWSLRALLVSFGVLWSPLRDSLVAQHAKNLINTIVFDGKHSNLIKIKLFFF